MFQRLNRDLPAIGLAHLLNGCQSQTEPALMSSNKRLKKPVAYFPGDPPTLIFDLEQPASLTAGAKPNPYATGLWTGMNGVAEQIVNHKPEVIDIYIDVFQFARAPNMMPPFHIHLLDGRMDDGGQMHP